MFALQLSKRRPAILLPALERVIILSGPHFFSSRLQLHFFQGCEGMRFSSNLSGNLVAEKVVQALVNFQTESQLVVSFVPLIDFWTAVKSNRSVRVISCLNSRKIGEWRTVNTG